jgi:Flagellar hook-associated protein 2 C-terminus
VVSDATGSRLVLSAASTGADNGFRIQADPADVGTPALTGNHLGQFGFDPAVVAGAGQGMQLVQAAQDAQLTLDGRPLSSASNVVDDAESGLRLNLQATTPSAVRLDVQADDDLIQHKLQALGSGSQDLMAQALQPDRPDDPGTRQARQAAGEVLDTLRSSLGGPDAAAWQAMGLSWDEQAGVRLQDVTWTDELRQQAQSMFAALQQRWPQATAEAQQRAPTPALPPTALPATAAEVPGASSASAAVVQRNRQRLLEQYDPAPGDLARQDLAVS